MPGKMRAARIQVFTRRHEDEEAKNLGKNFYEKTMNYYFFLSTIVSFLKGAPGHIANVTYA